MLRWFLSGKPLQRGFSRPPTLGESISDDVRPRDFVAWCDPPVIPRGVSAPEKNETPSPQPPSARFRPPRGDFHYSSLDNIDAIVIRYNLAKDRISFLFFNHLRDSY
ncbi:hypothetical protein PUN28_003890 [Cardiocondyla obscurior]|uniref:Uncharacterized protein n=1 Tax=Cardiocondyla obscurior TaxID=286306 RepID=A0AAW2GMP7_9HYME